MIITRLNFTIVLKRNSGCNKFAVKSIAGRGETAIDAEEGGKRSMQPMLFLLHGKIREDVSPPVKTLKTVALSPDVFCKGFTARKEIAERFRQSHTISSMAHGIIERLLAAVGGGNTRGKWGSI
jgi:hypothetical protein